MNAQLFLPTAGLARLSTVVYHTRAGGAWIPMVGCAFATLEYGEIQCGASAGDALTNACMHGAGVTPLHRARDVETVRALLAYEAKVNAPAANRRTPLHAAVRTYVRTAVRQLCMPSVSHCDTYAPSDRI